MGGIIMEKCGQICWLCSCYKEGTWEEKSFFFGCPDPSLPSLNKLRSTVFVHGELSSLWLLPMSSWVGTHPVPEKTSHPTWSSCGDECCEPTGWQYMQFLFGTQSGSHGNRKGCAYKHVCAGVCVDAHTPITADLISHSSAMQAFPSTYTCCLSGFSHTAQTMVCTPTANLLWQKVKLEPFKPKFPLYTMLNSTEVQLQVLFRAQCLIFFNPLKRTTSKN